MNLFQKAALIALSGALAVSLVGCGGNDTPADSASPSPSETPVESPEESETPDIGVYKSDHFEVTYPPDSLQLTESEMNEDGSVYLVSLTPVGEDAGTVPRIDIMSVTLDGLTEEAVSELSEDDTKKAYEAFACSLVSAYYGVELDENGLVPEDSGLDMSCVDTEVEVNDNDKHCVTTIGIGVTDDLPAMRAVVEMSGIGENGLTTILFTPSDTDPASMEVLTQTMESIAYFE